MSKKSFKLGLLGLGKVGLNVLVQNAQGAYFNIFWIADSKNFITKTDSSPFSKKEQLIIARSKQKIRESKPKLLGQIPNLSVASIKDPRDEASLIKEKIADVPREWAILDATSTKLEVEFEIVKSAMGCLAYCTCNKTVWGDYKTCSTLFDEAESKKTFLGLNCTTGVWVDQMDILPVIFNAYRAGDLKITKRDNSSFNLFLDMIEHGGSVAAAMSKLEKGGYLEPGSLGLETEAKDQFTKAKIAANIIGKLTGIRPSCKDGSESGLGETGRPKSKAAIDIAKWLNDARKSSERSYPALVSRILMDGSRLKCKLDFESLPRGSPLARNFPGKNVILVEATGNTKFEWVGNKKRTNSKIAGKNYFLHSGYGGAFPTATKLLKEARSILSMTNTISSEATFPIPMLYALNQRLPFAVGFENNIANHLSQSNS